MLSATNKGESVYKVVRLEDCHECDTCGDTYANGYRIFKDGEVVKERTPNAHCYGGQDYPEELALIDILKLEGIKIDMKPWEWMIPEDEREGNNE